MCWRLEIQVSIRGFFMFWEEGFPPLDGIGPDDVNIQSLVDRLDKEDEVKEVILALSSTMEGDTTAFLHIESAA